MRDRVQCRNPRARSVRSFACLLHVSAPQRLPQGAVVCCTGGVYETFYRLLGRIAIGSTDQTTKTTERRVVFHLSNIPPPPCLRVGNYAPRVGNGAERCGTAPRTERWRGMSYSLSHCPLPVCDCDLRCSEDANAFSISPPSPLPALFRAGAVFFSASSSQCRLPIPCPCACWASSLHSANALPSPAPPPPPLDRSVCVVCASRLSVQSGARTRRGSCAKTETKLCKAVLLP